MMKSKELRDHVAVINLKDLVVFTFCLVSLYIALLTFALTLRVNHTIPLPQD